MQANTATVHCLLRTFTTSDPSQKHFIIVLYSSIAVGQLVLMYSQKN